MQLARVVNVNKVAIYIRWSTEDQGEGTTLDVQMDACKAYILSQGWSTNDDLIFVDDGISGGTLDRPALSRLRAQVKAGKVDCVVVYKLDRLSRSVVDMVRLVLDEWEGFCHIKSAREPIDTLTQTGKMFFYQLMSFAEWERSVIKERTFSGKLRRAQEGRNPGMVAAYGYRLGSNSEFIIEPGEAAVVQLMFRVYLSGLGVRRVANRMNELGHRSPTGKRWDPSTVARMLGNPIYTGTMVYGKERTIRGKRHVRGIEPHVVKEGVAPVIIDAATFGAVQKMKEDRPGVGSRGAGGRAWSSQSLLTGLLKCKCGRSFLGTATNARARYRYYACSASNGKGHLVCDCGQIRQDLLDDLVVTSLMAQCSSSDAMGRVMERVTAQLELDLREAQAANEAVIRELARVDDKEARLKAIFLDGDITVSEFRDLKASLNRQLADLRSQKAAAEIRVEQAARALKARSQVVERLNMVNRWDVLEQHQRKQLLRHFVNQIQAYRDPRTKEIECTISWRWASGESEEVTLYTFSHPRVTEAVLTANRSRPRGKDGKFQAKRLSGN